MARFDLIPPQDETTDGTASPDTVVGSASGGDIVTYDMPASYYSNISSVVVSEDGTIYGYDWQNVYLFDSEGKYLATIEAGDNGGELKRLDANTVGSITYIYDAENETGSNYFVPINVETKSYDTESTRPRCPTARGTSIPVSRNMTSSTTTTARSSATFRRATPRKSCSTGWTATSIRTTWERFAVMNDGRIIAVLNHWDDETQTSINERWC